MLKSTDNKAVTESTKSSIKKSAETASEKPIDNPVWQKLALGQNVIQPKLTVGQPNDPYEREADDVADKVMRKPLETTEDTVQLKAKKAAANQPQTSANVESTVRRPGGGAPLSENVRSRIEPVLGADLADVRVHTNSQAQSAAADIHARAFTHNNDIFIGANGSPDDLRLMAHESTHTIQQRGNNSVGSVLQRDDEPSGPNAHVGGTSGVVNFAVNDNTANVVAPGDTGYSDLVLAGTGQAAGDLAAEGLYQDARLAHVLPATEGLDQQLVARSKTLARFKGEVRGDDSILAPWGVAKRAYQGGVDWCQNHMNIMEQDRAEEHQKAAEFNGWVPQANSFFESLLRLDATQNMLGVSDPSSLSSALLQGLDQASVVSGRARESFTSGGDKIDVPEPDESVSALANEVNVSARQMGVAYLGFQQSLLSERKKLAHADGNTARERMTEIADVKTFLGNVGKTVDITYSVVGSAPSVMNKASSYVRHGEASLNAARNRRQILAGGRPSHNPTYLATDSAGEMVVRNVQTGMDRNLMTGNSEEMIDPFASAQLPTSAESLLTTIADFAYSEEVKQLTRTLAAVGARRMAIQGVIDGLVFKEKAAAFSAAMLDFSVKCADLHRRIVARRQAYLDLGIQLDNFARDNSESKSDGSAPGKDEEKFATIFLCVSTVLEVLAVGNGAIGGAPFTSRSFASWARGVSRNRRLSAPRTDIPVFSISTAEWAALAKIHSQVKTFESNVGLLQNAFGGVESKAAEVMSGMDPATQGDPSLGTY